MSNAQAFRVLCAREWELYGEEDGKRSQCQEKNIFAV